MNTEHDPDGKPDVIYIPVCSICMKDVYQDDDEEWVHV